MIRFHTFEGVRNFRDFGDYGAGARRIKKGALYRSAHHAHASESDLHAMAALKLAVIVDLRRRQERTAQPSRRWPGFDAQIIENDVDDEDQEQYEAAYRAFLSQDGVTPAGIETWGADWYAKAALEARHIDLFSRYFHALAEAPGPVLIHCAGGKDRTGILAALTHHIAGVTREDIVEDYLHTNRPETFERAAKEVSHFLAGLGDGSNARPEIARAIIEIKPAYLDAAFSAMNERYGSIDNYLTRALGVSAHVRDAIEARILV